MLQPCVTSACGQRSGAPYGQRGEALRCLLLVLRASRRDMARRDKQRPAQAARRIQAESTPAVAVAMRYGLAAGLRWAGRAGGRFNGCGPHHSGNVTCESGAAVRPPSRFGSSCLVACQLWLIYRWACGSVSPIQSPSCPPCVRIRSRND